MEELGTTDVRLVKQEKKRLQALYQDEIDAFIAHLR